MGGAKMVIKPNINARIETSAYLFVHFVGNESSALQEQVYFSVSSDGKSWHTINGGEPLLVSTVGECGVRDPFIMRGKNGRFFLIATDLSIYNRRDSSNRWQECQREGSKNIVVWESSDLVNWGNGRLVRIAPQNMGCVWAPEAIYDPEKDAYMLFWASKIADDDYQTKRIYKSYTRDFTRFTAPELYIDGGDISNIDTTITYNNGMYYRFTKNESRSSVTMMRCEYLCGTWQSVVDYSLNGVAGNCVTGYEGPTVFKLNGEDKWCLLLDCYSKGLGYKPFITDNLDSGRFVSTDDFSFDATYRHGTVIPITAAEYNRLLIV
jgi:hypothetical protein